MLYFSAPPLVNLLNKKKVSNAEACRTYRQRLKENPQKHFLHTAADRERSRQYRKTEKTEVQKEVERANARERARQYR